MGFAAEQQQCHQYAAQLGAASSSAQGRAKMPNKSRMPAPSSFQMLSHPIGLVYFNHLQTSLAPLLPNR